jgi:hypothetical protein
MCCQRPLRSDLFAPTGNQDFKQHLAVLTLIRLFPASAPYRIKCMLLTGDWLGAHVWQRNLKRNRRLSPHGIC